MKRMAILQVTPEAFRELLHLPPGATLIDVHVPFDQPGVMHMKIEGEGWATPEGGVICRAEPGEVIRHGNGRILVDWKLPRVTPNAGVQAHERSAAE